MIDEQNTYSNYVADDNEVSGVINKQLTDYKYVKKDIENTSSLYHWLKQNNFYQNIRFSDSENNIEAYSIRFPVYKYLSFVILECELTALIYVSDKNHHEFIINVYEYQTNDKYHPFYYYEYGNYEHMIDTIWHHINNKLKKLGIKRIKLNKKQYKESKDNHTMLNTIDVKINKLKDNAIIPTKGSKYSAGYDLYAYIKHNYSLSIESGKTVKISTGIAVEIPEGYFGAIFARSGIATDRGLRPANCVGVIDSDYRGEIIVSLHNDSDVTQVIQQNDRIAQLVIMPYLDVNFINVEKLDESERGKNGYGSTGK